MIDLSEYIAKYKKNWGYIHKPKMEGYKWLAFARFQEKFDISKKGKDFYDMLCLSTDKSANLLSDHRFYGRDTLLKNAEVSPDVVRGLFLKLYNEDEELAKRVVDFKHDFRLLNRKNIEEYGIKTKREQSHQSTRAISLYLAYRYPDRYYLYFHKMYLRFAERVGYPFETKNDDVLQFLDYLEMCKQVRSQLETHPELITFYEEQMEKETYKDYPNHHLLTQDFIYAVAFHLNDIEKEIGDKPVNVLSVKMDSLSIKKVKPSMKGSSVIDYAEESQKNKKLGDAGESFVVRFEKESLSKQGRPDLAELVEHTASKRDGAGYDVLSYDIDGNTKHIEVKTTRGKFETTFYVSESERLFSEHHSESFYLYRVYNFDDTSLKGDIKIIQGTISGLCNPVSYRVDLVEK